MRQMVHFNVNPFIGVILEPPLIFIVTEFCQKGALKVSKIKCLNNPETLHIFRTFWKMMTLNWISCFKHHSLMIF